MNRDDDPYMRERVMFLFVADNRDELGTRSVAERIYNSSGPEAQWDLARVRRALRQLRRDGLVEQDVGGAWRFTPKGLVRAREELQIAANVRAARERMRQALRERDEAIRNGTYVPPPVPPAVPRTTVNTFEAILKCGWAGGKMFGAALVVTEKPGG